jgi:hypothetical protein
MALWSSDQVLMYVIEADLDQTNIIEVEEVIPGHFWGPAICRLSVDVLTV